MVDTIKFSQMTNAGDINNNDIMPSLRGGENVILNNPWTFLPAGTTAQRPLPSSTINYRLRFNTDVQLYEYYDAVLSMWTQIQESAFTAGPFVTYTANASLPDAQNLGALSDGILKQTITTGVATLNIAVNGTDYFGPGFVIPGTDGGTGINNGALTINLGSGSLGLVLTSDVSGNATWQPVSSSGGITTIDGDTGSAVPTLGVVTLTGDSTGLTFTGATNTLTLGGTLAIAHGGTGVTSVTIAPTATSFAGWDANKNFSANAFIPGYTTTVTAAGTTTLSIASTEAQFFTGTTTQTVTLPVVSTLAIGQRFYIVNNSSGVVTIQSSGGNTVQAMAANTTCNLTCILNSGTTAASWYAEYAFQSGSSSGTVNNGSINQLAYYAANGNAVSGLAIVNSAGLLTNASGVPAWVAYTGTGAPVLANTPTLITPVLGAATATSLNFGASATNGIIGVTGASNAAAGVVGESMISTVLQPSALSPTSNTVVNITTLTLTAGDWDVYGNVNVANGGGLIQGAVGWVSLTSATQPDAALYSAWFESAGGTINTWGSEVPTLRVNVTTNTTVYLSGFGIYSGGTILICGKIQARRRR